MNEGLWYTFKASASTFVTFHNTIRLQHFSFILWMFLPSRLVTIFAFHWNPLLAFIILLSRKSNKTASWPEGTSWKKYRCQQYDFSRRSRRSTKFQLRVCSLVWLVMDSTMRTALGMKISLSDLKLSAHGHVQTYYCCMLDFQVAHSSCSEGGAYLKCYWIEIFLS